MTRILVLALGLAVVAPSPVRSDGCVALGDTMACDEGSEAHARAEVERPPADLSCTAMGDMACD